jgi:DNA-binding NtrC family response regulator
MTHPSASALLSSSRIRRDMELAAACDVPVLISAGTSEAASAIAFWIHRHGRRRETPWMQVDVATARPGAGFELFDRLQRMLVDGHGGGTLLLTHINTMSPATQEALCRFMDLNDASAGPGVRVISGARGSIFTSVRAGRFRHDLFYRLNGIHIIVAAAPARATVAFEAFSGQRAISR